MIYSRFPRGTGLQPELTGSTEGKPSLDDPHVEADPEEERLFRDLWEDPSRMAWALPSITPPLPCRPALRDVGLTLRRGTTRGDQGPGMGEA